jgi:molecular chaperone DnaK
LNGEIAKDSVDFTKIRDVIPMSLGVEVYGGDFSTIIPKNTQIPVRLHETYKTAHNNQTSVQIVVYQGEDGRAVNNDKLGEFYLNGIPPGLAEAENIQVYLEITEQGILHVKAECCSTGGSKDLPITEYKNRLSKAAIQKLLAEG